MVLKIVYTGEDLLTNDNFLEVWRAVHQLQIDHLIKCCEEFGIKAISTETFEDIFKHAHVLNSSSVQDETTRFMLQEFAFVRKTKTFLELPFKALISLIKSQKLNVSTEDIVFNSVLEWVEFVPCSDNIINPLEFYDTDQHGPGKNDSSCETQCSEQKYQSCESSKLSTTQDNSNITLRHHLLINLLTAVRMCLVSPPVLDSAFKHKPIACSLVAREIIFNALKYHISEFKQSQWPSAALHRDCSEFVNVGITAFGAGKFKVFSVSEGTWHDISECEDVRNCNTYQMAATSDNVYFSSNDQSGYKNREVYMLKETKWQKVCEKSDYQTKYLLLAHGSSIYLLGTNYNTIYQFDFIKGTQIKLNGSPAGISLKYAMSYGNNIIIFCAEKNEYDVDETAVYVLDLPSQVWTRLINLNGPANHLISFRNDENTFILQANGSLWAVDGSMTETIRFKLIAQLWDFISELNGAITQGNKLIIFVSYLRTDPVDKIQKTTLQGYFKCITYMGRSGHSSNFIPVVLPKVDLVKKCQ